MIWSILSKDEKESYKTPPVFHHYQEALGRDNISLVEVDRHDPLDFVNGENDIVLLRNVSQSLIKTIRRKNFRTTAEEYEKYALTCDKQSLSFFLNLHNVLTPKQYNPDQIINGRYYFVKPRYGSDSFGITEKSICCSRSEVLNQLSHLRRELNTEAIIEEYIEGTDCTVSCYVNQESKQILTHAIEMECSAYGGIQTFENKSSYEEFCVALTGNAGKSICEISRKVFEILDLKHHARFDFRKTPDGRLFLIDANLIPGLGPLGDFSKCLLLTANMSYIDSLMAIINSACR